VPVPSSYTVGAGDEIIVQLFGQLNETHRLRVNRAGIINFPSIGPLPVAGMKFSDVRRTLAMRVEEQLIGVRSDVTLGELRTMQIFVAGDAYKPGAYTVSALTTMSQAIYFSGGFSEQGALRNVQLKRDGKVIAKLDLYDLLLKGDSSDDLRLLPGDVVHIAPVGSTIAIDGEINRPAVYEILPGESYQTVIALAGGLNSQADNRKIEVKRYLPNGGKEIITLDLTKASDQRLSAKSGDAVTVLKKSAELTNYVKLEGDIVQAGYRQWRPKQRIADLFSDINSSFNSSADVNYALLVREINHQRDIEVHQIDIAAAILAPNGKENKELRPRDKIIVFNRFDPRELDQVLTHKATLQSSDDEASMAKSYETAIEQAARDKQEKQQQNQTSVVQVLEQSTQSGIANRQQ
ncbi:MAG: SLBB domain-containing protein, partial [Vibrionaceae bacterium]